jgi:hypothetical protein
MYGWGQSLSALQAITQKFEDDALALFIYQVLCLLVRVQGEKDEGERGQNGQIFLALIGRGSKILVHFF